MTLESGSGLFAGDVFAVVEEREVHVEGGAIVGVGDAGVVGGVAEEVFGLSDLDGECTEGESGEGESGEGVPGV